VLDGHVVAQERLVVASLVGKPVRWHVDSSVLQHVGVVLGEFAGLVIDFVRHRVWLKTSDSQSNRVSSHLCGQQ
jgi:hypothetical protein